MKQVLPTRRNGIFPLVLTLTIQPSMFVWINHWPRSPPSSQVITVDSKIFLTAPEINSQSKGVPSSVTAVMFFLSLDSIFVPFAANIIGLARLPVHGTAST